MPSRDRLVGFLAVVLLSAVVHGADGGTAEAAHRPRPGQVSGIGIRLLEAPVNRRNDPRARVAVVDHLAPGTTIKRRFLVTNTTGERHRVALYAAAADVTGKTFGFAHDRTQNELTRWITVTPGTIDLAPHSRRSAQFAIAVPPTAWRGERYGVIWAQISAPPDKHHNVGMITRVGIRVYLDIGAGGEPPSDLRIEKLTPERRDDGQPRLIAQVRNTGGRALDLSGRLALSRGPGGLRAGPFAAARGVVLKPGETGQAVFTLDRQLPNGPWQADINIQSGMVRRMVSTAVTFPATGSGKPISVLASTPLGLVATLAIITLAAAAVAAHLLRRRRRSIET